MRQQVVNPTQSGDLGRPDVIVRQAESFERREPVGSRECLGADRTEPIAAQFQIAQ